jgi:uncharacterized membrane protein (UPF0182 family)
MQRQRILLIVFVLFFLFILLRETVVGLLTDIWWFSAVGFLGVFTKSLLSQVVLFLGFAFLFLLFFYWNLRWASRRGGSRWMEFYAHLQIPREALERFRRLLVVAVAILMATALGSWAADNWLRILQAMQARSFGVSDPLFNRDLGFFFFTLPVLVFLKSWALWTLAVTAAAVLLLYYESRALGVAYNKLYVSPRVRLHLIFLASLLFLLLAWHFQLRSYELLYSGRGVVFGASYTDVHAELLGYRIMMGLSVLLFGAMVWGLWRKQVTLPLYAAGGYIAALILVTGLFPAAVQQFLVEPNEVTREQPYIEHAIHYTRFGYGLEEVAESDFPATLSLSEADIERYPGTFRNIRLWDWRPLRQTYSQLQEMRLYYHFLVPDVDRYQVGGQLRQVLLAPREFDTTRLPAQAKTWVNQHVKYTHGYGVAMSPVNEVTAEGMPVFFLKDIPPQGEAGLEVTRPEVYYGELTTDYVLVRTSEQEFDYARGEDNVYSTYQGSGGVPIGNLWRRFIYALKYGQLKLLISEYPTAQTRLMENRTVRERVRKIAPFLRYDLDPYLVVADGRLVWILDAYTVSTRMPYSDPSTGGVNYIRNSVKVTVDAFDGSVRFYLAAPDPITGTLEAIFPGLFRPFAEMPEAVRRHIRVPIDLFELQADKWRLFHMEDPRVFYNQEDLWMRPTEIYAGNEVPMEAYYIVLSLQEGEDPEFILMLPYTPSGKDNMVAWLAARCDPAHYGELLLYKFSKQELIYGPMQIEARIDQDPVISEQLTLWSQQGSSVIRGNLLVIPIGESLLYAEPLYLRAERSDLPELKRVILSYGPQVVMTETLEAGLRAVLGGRAPAVELGPAPGGAPGVEIRTPTGTVRLPAEQAARALQLYEQAQEHLKAGRWAEYGRSMEQLGELLRQLDRALKGGPGGDR